MKKLVVMLLAFALVIGSIPNSQGVVKASDSNEPVITYNDGVMAGNGLSLVVDGDYANGYVSEDDPDLSDGKQYIQFAWAQEVDYNSVTLYSKYCGTANTQGQAPTKWKIQTSVDGETYADVAEVTAEWAEGDDAQSKSANFTSTDKYKYIRIVILEAKLDWKHYVISEIEFATKILNVGVYEDSNETTQYAKAATVTYNDGVMSGMGLSQVADGNYTTTYVSEDNPDMSNQYIQFVWNEPIDVNLVTLYSQYCGTADKDGQAPTEWTIQVSKDGATFTEVCKVSKEWNNNDDVQSKNTQFDLQEDIVAMRIVITEANLDWNHYAISEIEVGKAKDGFVASDIIGTTENDGTDNDTNDEKNEGVYKDSNESTQYAKAATVTYSNSMSGMGLAQVADGNYTTTYVSEDNPDMKNQYIQFAWNEPVDINMVTLYVQYCGTKYKDGQAPTAWTIQVSKDGTNFTEVCKVSKKWRSNDNLQSKSVQFDLQEDIVAVRIVITEAKLDWNHYAISEIEIGQSVAGFVASDLTGIGTGTSTKAPQTGDSASPVYLIALMALSLGGICVCTYRRKKY